MSELLGTDRCWSALYIIVHRPSSVVYSRNDRTGVGVRTCIDVDY